MALSAFPTIHIVWRKEQPQFSKKPGTSTRKRRMYLWSKGSHAAVFPSERHFQMCRSFVFHEIGHVPAAAVICVVLT